MRQRPKSPKMLARLITEDLVPGETGIERDVPDIKVSDLDMYYITDPTVDVDTKWGHSYSQGDLPAVSIMLRGTRGKTPFVATVWSTQSKGNETIIEEGDVTEDEVLGVLEELRENNPNFGEAYDEAYGKAFVGEHKGKAAKGYELVFSDQGEIYGYSIPNMDVNYPDNLLP